MASTLPIKLYSMHFNAHFLLLLLLLFKASSSNNNGFTFTGNLEINGVKEISPDNRVIITNRSTTWGVGHAFYAHPLRFKNSSSSDSISFSTTFIFGILPENPLYAFHGMAFVIAPSKDIASASSSQHLGLFNRTNDGQTSNHILAIEFDTFKSLDVGDIDNNHVGLDLNSIVSVKSTPAGYFSNENGEFKNITLAGAKEIQAWVDYNGVAKKLDVRLAPLHVNKPTRPLLSMKIDISPFLLEKMYVGFSSATGVLKQSYYVLGWSFEMNGKDAELDLSKVPLLPASKILKKKPMILIIGCSITGFVLLVSLLILALVFVVNRRHKFKEVLEDWEVQYGPHRFSYKDLYLATKGFKFDHLLGKGGFGQVYRGMLPELNVQVAVKKISHESSQGMKEFVAEIATIGRLRHPNLVRLLGYCRRKGELVLVNDFMPNASLDKFLFDTKEQNTLTWNQRFKIVKDVAEGLAYLHEGWVEVVIHRDIKASNVLLDGDLNGKLGDFGLARCCHNGQDAQTTHIAGTLGYIAPELARKGKATTTTDVFAFGAFCLEVACGRRPVVLQALPDEVILCDWVLNRWAEGDIIKTVDLKLKGDFNVEEMELVLKIGLLCSHSVASVRPSMSLVLRYLKGEAMLPENFDDLLAVREDSGRLFEMCSCSATPLEHSRPSITITESFTSIGR